MHLLYWCMNLETWHNKNRFYKLLKKVKRKNFFLEKFSKLVILIPTSKQSFMHLLYWCMNLETRHDKNRFYKLLKKVKSKNFFGKILKAGDINTNFKTILYASTLLVYEFRNLARQE